MDRLFLLTANPYPDPAVEEWLSGEPHRLYNIASQWFSVIRQCGEDVQEVLHDGCPTACVDGAAFAYVNVFKAHVNIGFFTGAFLADPEKLLSGTGKRMRHVKIVPESTVNEMALRRLISDAYDDIKARLQEDQLCP